MSLKAKEKVLKLRKAQHELRKLRQELECFHTEMGGMAKGQPQSDLFCDENDNILVNVGNDLNNNAIKLDKDSDPISTPLQHFQSKFRKRAILAPEPIQGPPLPNRLKTNKPPAKGKVIEVDISKVPQKRNVQPHQGRLFRHTYKYQDSLHSPLASRVSSLVSSNNLPLLPSKNVSPGVNTRKDGIMKTLRWTESVRRESNTSSISSITRKDNREMSKIFVVPHPQPRKGPSTWINGGFPSESDMVIKDDLDKNDINHRYPLPHTVKRRKRLSRSRSKSLSREQLPPHKRGLVGVEISSVEPQCFYFFRGQNGLLNPHLQR